jgi:alcohol dehydrogenase class IV
MRFDFATATRVLFGAGALREVGPIAGETDTRALVVTGRNPDRARNLQSLLSDQGVRSILFPVTGEPEIDTVQRGTTLARAEGCELVISFGGGSAIDAGKAIAAMLTNPGELLDYLEVIGRGKALVKPSAPFIAIPTTAGTGAEVTRNAVLASPEHRVKVSLRSPFMLPKLALVDPELTYGLSPEVTARTGLDAMTQLIEPYVSSRANPMTDALCVEGIARAARSLAVVYSQGDNAAARQDMCVASLFGGLALANAGLGAVHGFAGPIGGSFPAPHGAVCAVLLPEVMEINLSALCQRAPGSGAPSRYQQVARLLTGNTNAGAEDGVAWVRKLVAQLKIPKLREYGLKPEHIPGLVHKSSKASSMKANPILLTDDELTTVLQNAL